MIVVCCCCFAIHSPECLVSRLVVCFPTIVIRVFKRMKRNFPRRLKQKEQAEEEPERYPVSAEREPDYVQDDEVYYNTSEDSDERYTAQILEILPQLSIVAASSEEDNAADKSMEVSFLANEDDDDDETRDDDATDIDYVPGQIYPDDATLIQLYLQGSEDSNDEGEGSTNEIYDERLGVVYDDDTFTEGGSILTRDADSIVTRGTLEWDERIFPCFQDPEPVVNFCGVVL